jgi:thiol:disulfide interchange protein
MSAQAYEDANEINWIDYETGMSQAESMDKPIIIDFYTDWCTWCQVMENSTYIDPVVVARSKEFVCIKVDGDRNEQLVNEYNIEGYPTTFFLMPDGSVFDKTVGYIEPDDFLQKMDAAITEYNDIKSGNSGSDQSPGFRLTSFSLMGIISVIIIVAIIIVLIRDSKKTT